MWLLVEPKACHLDVEVELGMHSEVQLASVQLEVGEFPAELEPEEVQR